MRKDRARVVSPAAVVKENDAHRVLLSDEHAPDRVLAVAAEHAAYWRGAGLRGYLGGPFADRSGGLIIFETGSAQQAGQLVAGDPFVREDLLERRWVKEWMTD